MLHATQTEKNQRTCPSRFPYIEISAEMTATDRQTDRRKRLIHGSQFCIRDDVLACRKCWKLEAEDII